MNPARTTPSRWGGKREGAGRKPTGKKHTFLVAIRPALFSRLEEQLELAEGGPLEEKEVLDRARRACYQTLEGMASTLENEHEQAKIL